MSWARVRALQRLAVQPRTLSELAEQLAADRPYVTLIVDGLEERGLVQRTPHPEDRRAKLVQLTEAGRAAAARANAILDEPPAALHDAPDEDLEALLRVLERLAEPLLARGLRGVAQSRRRAEQVQPRARAIRATTAGHAELMSA